MLGDIKKDISLDKVENRKGSESILFFIKKNYELICYRYKTLLYSGLIPAHSYWISFYSIISIDILMMNT